jgi:hypothetical protein
MSEIRVRNKRSRKDTQGMILDMAKYGDHSVEDHEGVPLETDEDVKRFFAECEVDFHDFVEDCRNKDEKVPEFENLLGGTWQVNSGGGWVSYVDESGEEAVLASGGESGWFTVPGYLGLFEQAVGDFERCVKSMKYGDFLSCVSNGVASIEAYIEQRARVHNKHNPGNQLIDNKQNKVSRDDKIDEWIPIMTGGTKLNKGNQRWEHYKKLRNIRDQQQAHLKAPALGSDYRKLATLLNLFRTGIAGMLLELHVLFGDRNISATIIRNAYLPEVEYEAQST